MATLLLGPRQSQDWNGTMGTRGPELKETLLWLMQVQGQPLE